MTSENRELRITEEESRRISILKAPAAKNPLKTVRSRQRKVKEGQKNEYHHTHQRGDELHHIQ